MGSCDENSIIFGFLDLGLYLHSHLVSWLDIEWMDITIGIGWLDEKMDITIDWLIGHQMDIKIGIGWLDGKWASQLVGWLEIEFR